MSYNRGIAATAVGCHYLLIIHRTSTTTRYSCILSHTAARNCYNILTSTYNNFILLRSTTYYYYFVLVHITLTMYYQ